MKNNFLCLVLALVSFQAVAQNVGIGTNSPNAKAALEIKSSDKGVLFPRLTSAQRNAITDPPNGLHIYNTDERCLNYFDSLYQVWNCYCVQDTCKTVTLNITADVCGINFNTVFASSFPGVKRFVILINPGVNITCGTTIGAIDFTTVPDNTSIKIINKGNIWGIGAGGGAGALGQVGGPCNRPGQNGYPGGHAITTKATVQITIDNYGIIAGGGGGGGGGGRNVLGEFGGGGGGGAGNTGGPGATGGGNGFSGPFGSCGTVVNIAQNGSAGTLNAGGPGGNGANGGGNGGTGGLMGQAGQNGTGANAGIGGPGGKVISGGSGNIVVNKSGGQTFGTVD